VSSTRYRFRATVLTAAIAAGGAVGVAAIGLVSQLLEDDQVAIDCGAYMKTLGDMAANPEALRMVTTNGTDGKPLLNFGKQADECGEPGPILEGLAKASTDPTLGAPSTTLRP
jgi:hypothetical protein